MKYQITYACGHAGTVCLYGPGKARERKLQWLAEQDCPECHNKAQQEKIDQSNAGLPELTGTEKQVIWARTIRANIMTDITREQNRIDEKIRNNDPAVDATKVSEYKEWCAKLTGWLHSQTAAAWWIDRRHQTWEAMVKEFIRKEVKK